MTDFAPGALERLKVIDLTWAYSGPFASMLMGDYGADVIKIERLSGDRSRGWEPIIKGKSIYFDCANRNKRSIAIDLKSREGVEIVREMVKKTDIVLENFRPGVAERLGLDYNKLSEINPRLIMASISGYGQTGERRFRGAMSHMAEAESGFLYVNGYPNNPPVGSGVPLGDSVAGLFAVCSVMMALYERERTGKGQYIDVAMTDSMVYMMATVLSASSIMGENIERKGNREAACYPYDLFKAKDGYIFLGFTDMENWEPFARIIGMPHLTEDERFKTNLKRIENADELYEIINAWCEERTADEIMTLFEENKQLSALCKSPLQVVSDGELIERRAVVKGSEELFGDYMMQGFPFIMSRTPGSLRRPAPDIGEHTRQILSETGYSKGTIDEFIQRKIVL